MASMKKRTQARWTGSVSRQLLFLGRLVPPVGRAITTYNFTKMLDQPDERTGNPLSAQNISFSIE